MAKALIQETGSYVKMRHLVLHRLNVSRSPPRIDTTTVDKGRGNGAKEDVEDRKIRRVRLLRSDRREELAEVLEKRWPWRFGRSEKFSLNFLAFNLPFDPLGRTGALRTKRVVHLAPVYLILDPPSPTSLALKNRCHVTARASSNPYGLLRCPGRSDPRHHPG